MGRKAMRAEDKLRRPLIDTAWRMRRLVAEGLARIAAGIATGAL